MTEDNPELQRGFGLVQATALNVSMIVGAGVFITIPYMLLKLPGPYALLGWLAAGLLMLMDGLIWSELGAALPGSGGSYLYLLECYGKHGFGRLMAFLFVWQFLISGPLEVGSAFIAMATFANGLGPDFERFNQYWTWRLIFCPDPELGITLNPARLAAFSLGVFIVFLLYRRITTLGRLTVTIWLGVLGILGFILVDGFLHFDPAVAFDFSGAAAQMPDDFAVGLGGTMALAMYAYLGYFNVCYIGDEVRDPGKTIPRAIMLSAVLVCVLFTLTHLAMLGVVSWRSIPTDPKALANYSLPTAFAKELHGSNVGTLLSLLLIWSCFGSAFAGLLGYSRIPYGAARYGHFFSALGQVHPEHRIPHVSLLVVSGLTLFWSFFDLSEVISALITTRILEQFIGQVIGVMILRRTRPDLPRPYRIWLYPLPCLLALVGWLYIYVTAGRLYIVLGLATLLTGVAVFLVWARRTRRWPFGIS